MNLHILLLFAYIYIAGLEKQAREIQDIINVSIATDEANRNFRFNIPCGILVCGNVGVGKTTLLKSLETHFEKKTKVMFLQTETLITNFGKFVTSIQYNLVSRIPGDRMY